MTRPGCARVSKSRSAVRQAGYTLWIHSDDKTGVCTGVANPECRPFYEIEITYGDMVERARLRVDLIKWFVSKKAPKRYGTAPARDPQLSRD